MSNIKVFTDGGSRGNPGHAACAFVVYDNDTEIAHGSKYLGLTTNNVAEYEGVLLAIDWIIKNKSSENSSSLQINFVLDSELVVKQLVGIYKVKDEKMKNLYTQIKSAIVSNNLKTTFTNVARSLNKVADGLVNEELDKQKL